MQKFLFTAIALGFLSLCNFAHAQGSFGYSNWNTSFGFGFAPAPSYAPPARYDSHVAPSLVKAAKLADQRAGRHSTSRCWHFVKDALVAAGAVRNRPESAYAIQAGDELMKQDGFVKLRVSDPYNAPVGAVIVYSGFGGAGHVELRTASGFASDYRSHFACRGRMVGVYVKLAS
jgi:hypothetical protein